MPRKRTEGKIMNVNGGELKTVRLELPEETHQALRIEAAINGTSMVGFVRMLVEKHLATAGKGQTRGAK